MVQVYVLLAVIAQITGNKAGQAYHKIVNAHIYEDQLELMRDVQLKREPKTAPTFHMNPEIKSLEDLETWVTLDDFELKKVMSITILFNTHFQFNNIFTGISKTENPAIICGVLFYRFCLCTEYEDSTGQY